MDLSGLSEREIKLLKDSVTDLMDKTGHQYGYASVECEEVRVLWNVLFNKGYKRKG